jgi:hypothetical protein
MAQAERGLSFVHAGAKQLELEDGGEFAEIGRRRRPEAQAALPHTRERAVVLTELVLKLRQPGYPQGVEPIGVDLREVVADVEHREPVNFEG